MTPYSFYNEKKALDCKPTLSELFYSSKTQAHFPIRGFPNENGWGIL